MRSAHVGIYDSVAASFDSFCGGRRCSDGKLKIKGTAAVGSTLSADFTEVKPEGLDETA